MDKSVLRTTVRATLLSVVLALASICALVTCSFAVWVFQKDIATQFDIWRAEGWLRQWYGSMPTLTDDIRLSEDSPPRTTTGGTLACVYGYAHQYYGSQRTYDEVVAAYTAVFSEMGWQSETLVWHDVELTDFYQSEDLKYMITIRPPEQIVSDYPTTYAIVFGYNKCCEFCRNALRRHG